LIHIPHEHLYYKKGHDIVRPSILTTTTNDTNRIKKFQSGWRLWKKDSVGATSRSVGISLFV
jgi:hypothetical protein